MSMDQAARIAETTLGILVANGVLLDAGLTRRELSAAEELVGSHFPPDLATLLSTKLPAGDKFPTWRQPDNPLLTDLLAHPTEGIVFDVLHASAWHPDWPERPVLDAEAEAVARAALANAPKLVPIYSHRFLPTEPLAVGNPVLSVMQTDIIFYGSDLAHYAGNEFEHGWRDPGATTRLPFWDYFLLND